MVRPEPVFCTCARRPGTRSVPPASAGSEPGAAAPRPLPSAVAPAIGRTHPRVQAPSPQLNTDRSLRTACLMNAAPSGSVSAAMCPDIRMTAAVGHTGRSFDQLRPAHLRHDDIRHHQIETGRVVRKEQCFQGTADRMDVITLRESALDTQPSMRARHRRPVPVPSPSSPSRVHSLLLKLYAEAAFLSLSRYVTKVKLKRAQQPNSARLLRAGLATSPRPESSAARKTQPLV